jgi:crotonobetainyl-CoA:carnitine CoA-transferase CaiB-like acyl-CoA transferase
VVDFSAFIAGPYCTRLLADLGAEVIKVESHVGDVYRGGRPIRDGRSTYFGGLNAGKQSVVLDLRQPAGRDAARELIATADVVVENFRPGVMRRHELDYETVSEKKPGIVYCSVSGYGQEGPGSDRPATAQAVHAASGYDFAFTDYQFQAQQPPATGLFVADAMAGALAFGAILSALRTSERTGVGGWVDLSLHESMLSMLVYEVQAAQFPQGFVRKGYPPVPAREGFVMIAVVNDRNLEQVMKLIGRPELATDERFASNASRWRYMKELYDLIGEWAATRPADEIVAAALAAGIPSARYQRVEEQFDDPQLQSRGTFTTARDGSGQFQIVDTPFQVHRPRGAADSEPDPELWVDDLGEHTREVLAAVIGAARAQELIDRGIALHTPGAPAHD